MQRLVFSGFCALYLALIPVTLSGQQLVNDALAAFPPQTIRVEYSSPSKLRKLPNYQNLHQKFLGPRLQTLEGSLAALGIREDDIDDLVLGWQTGKSEMDLYGLASGRFDVKGIANRAANQGITPTPINGQQAYCLTAGMAGTCIVALNDSLGAFGSLTSLTALLDTRSGQSPNLGSDERFSKLVGSVNKDAPIWGIAVGPAVGDWFRGWMPSQNNLKLDWSRVFEKVNSLLYTVDAADKVNLNLKMDCATQEDASTLRTVMEGLKLAQQMAWQSQNPSRPNPFEAVQVTQDTRQLSLQLTTDYADLELAGGVGATPN